MSRPTVVVSLDAATQRRIDRLVQSGRFPTRSRAIEAAITAQLDRLERCRLSDECATLDPTEERALGQKGLAADLAEWPVY